MRVSLLFALIVAALLSGCIGAAYSPTPYDPVVWPYNDALAAPYYTIANANGVAPCGVFDVRGHGHKIAALSDYAACDAASFTIACLTGEGTWTDQYISKVEVEDGTIRFQSAQDGLCAIFPAG